MPDPSYLDEPDPFLESLEPVPARAEGASARQPTPVGALEHVGPSPLADEDLVPEAALGALADYDAYQRRLALERAMLLDRTVTPGIVPAPTPRGEGFEDDGDFPFAYLWVDPASNHIVYRTESLDPGVPRRVGAEILDELLQAGFRLVVPDTHTLARITRATTAVARRREPSSEAAVRIELQLAIAARLRYSAFAIVLTRALARRYWLPEGMDGESLAPWAAMGGAAPFDQDPFACMSALTDLACDGQDAPQLTNGMFFAERGALSAARFRGLKTAVSAFHDVERAEACAQGWDLTDFGLVRRNSITGDVCQVAITGIDAAAGRIHVVMSQPFRLRTGKAHTIVRPNPASPATNLALESVQATGDALHGVLTYSTRRQGNPAAAIAAAAYRDARPLFITGKPFAGFTPVTNAAARDRWTSPADAPVRRPRWAPPQ
ncbi:hypothetical protein CHO01_22930 [Cellulomonas hominis]|uniref:Uncharacterized protein n=1 Tax=Cellulomonas hominis TaxID=156981 RepID=A0A511FFS4_9CELL|nr:hypothetical protein [Cellulomonas hominis]MBB5474623.1 hypothetical protein [Cellulomonas hominis]NKY06262.1 hypothetical protein [Cellulomonas hominis]GEL47177.1 hypothetical protein CHO01_22930 [Cellulomonas hominis]